MYKDLNIFFLGIGGIGMSALARYLQLSGAKVSGYDRDKTKLTKKLEAEGMKIQYEFDEKLLDFPIDLVVYTPAIKPEQQEFQYFIDHEIRMLKRSEMLHKVLDQKKVIAIAGTHGKTTTSAFLAHILKENAFEATALVGGEMKNYDSNFIYGKGEWVIVEADEYDRSFLRLSPEIALIQAIDADHLDIYGTEESMVDAYQQFTCQIRKGGNLIVEHSVYETRMSQEWKDNLKKMGVEISSFGINQGSFNGKILKNEDGKTSFEIIGFDSVSTIMLPGVHNVRNALGAALIATKLGISKKGICNALENFQGIKRRFEYVVRGKDVVVIDDYAHHPKEIDAAIEAARNNHPGEQLTVVFQPHLYSRTKDFLEAFAESLSSADELILVELYPARENPVEGINSRVLLEMTTNKKKAFVPKRELAEYLVNDKRTLILLLGAGDVYKHINEIKEVLRHD